MCPLVDLLPTFLQFSVDFLRSGRGLGSGSGSRGGVRKWTEYIQRRDIYIAPRTTAARRRAQCPALLALLLRSLGFDQIAIK